MSEALTAREPQTERKVDRPLRCVRCINPITHSQWAVPIDGLHEHVQANPAGVVFAFGCFAQATGCDVIGDPELKHTWFPGHTWQVALCDQCLTHLGWYFHGPERAFFGLILNRLRGG